MLLKHVGTRISSSLFNNLYYYVFEKSLLSSTRIGLIFKIVLKLFETNKNVYSFTLINNKFTDIIFDQHLNFVDIKMFDFLCHLEYTIKLLL